MIGEILAKQPAFDARQMRCDALATRDAVWLERFSVVQKLDQHGLVGVCLEQASRVVGRIAMVIADLFCQLLVD